MHHPERLWGNFSGVSDLDFEEVLSQLCQLLGNENLVYRHADYVLSNRNELTALSIPGNHILHISFRCQMTFNCKIAPTAAFLVDGLPVPILTDGDLSPCAYPFQYSWSINAWALRILFWASYKQQSVSFMSYKIFGMYSFLCPYRSMVLTFLGKLSSKSM